MRINPVNYKEEYPNHTLSDLNNLLKNCLIKRVGDLFYGKIIIEFYHNNKLFSMPLYLKALTDEYDVLYLIAQGDINNIVNSYQKYKNLDNSIKSYREDCKKTSFVRIDSNISLIREKIHNKTKFMFWLYEQYMNLVYQKNFEYTSDEGKVYESVFAYILSKSDKGLAILGPVGVGKTTIFKFINWFGNTCELYEDSKESIGIREKPVQSTKESSKYIIIIPVIDLVKTCIRAEKDDVAYTLYDKYKKSTENAFCFDDLAVEENPIKVYGTNVFVMEEIIASRYNLGKYRLTNITSNYTLKQMRENNIYDIRTIDRMKEMFFFVEFPEYSKSNRKK